MHIQTKRTNGRPKVQTNSLALHAHAYVCVLQLWCGKLTVRQNPRAIYFHTNTDAIDVFHHNSSIRWLIRSTHILQIQTTTCRLYSVRWFWRRCVAHSNSIACINTLCFRTGVGSGNLYYWNDCCLPSRDPLTVRSAIRMIYNSHRMWNIVQEMDWTISLWFCRRILN